MDSKHPGLRFVNNDYFAKGGPVAISWRGSVYDSLAAWGARTGEERVGGRSTGRRVDPKLVQPAPLKLVLPVLPIGPSNKRFWIVLGSEIGIFAGLLICGITWWRKVTRRRRRVPELAPASFALPERDGQPPLPRAASSPPPLARGGNGAASAALSAPERVLREERRESPEPPPVAEHSAPDKRERPEPDPAFAPTQDERERLQQEIARLTALRDELRSEYRALALAALDALQEDRTRPDSGPATRA